MPVTLQDLHNVFKESAAGFADTQIKLKQYEDDAQAAVTALCQEAERYPFSRSELTDTKHPLHDILKKTQTGLNEDVEYWVKCIRNYEKNTSVRKRHEDSLLIYVYGQVKSGKSSLGNFIIYGGLDPDPLIVAKHDNVSVFWEDDSGAMNTTKEWFEKNKKFKIDYIEATSSIQGICIDGLTWIDSPGIHSTTPQNGQLAADYLDSADFILFISTSQSPCTRSEVEEIKTIVGKNKSFIFIIPKMDVVKPDEDEKGNIIYPLYMRDEKDREDARQWSMEHLHEKCGLDKNWLERNVITVSCLFAEKNRTPEGWQASGLSLLAERIAQVAEKDGFRLKQIAPLVRLIDYNNQILESLRTLQKRTEQLDDKISLFFTDVESSAKSALFDAKITVESCVTDCIYKHTTDSKAVKKELDDKIPSIVDEAARKIIQGMCTAGKELASNLQAGDIRLHDMTFPDVKKIEGSFSYTSRIGERVGKAGGALAGAAAGGIVIGATSSAIAGAAALAWTGPGALIGAAIGGLLGGLLGKAFNKKNTSTVVIGDTRDDVAGKITDQLCKETEEILDEFRKKLLDEQTGKVSEWLHEMVECMKNVERNLSGQNKEINKLKEEIARG